MGTAEQADGKGSAVPARDPQQAPRLQLREIYKAFGETTVLHGVDLEVQSGEIHGIVGQNGAGKSTLMNLLGGSYGNYRGAILIDGQHVEPGTPRGALALGVTVVHQEFSLVPTMTVAENIVLGGEANRGFRRKEVIKAAWTVIEALGMDQELSRSKTGWAR